jgi:hypothetical protein
MSTRVSMEKQPLSVPTVLSFSEALSIENLLRGMAGGRLYRGGGRLFGYDEKVRPILGEKNVASRKNNNGKYL